MKKLFTLFIALLIAGFAFADSIHTADADGSAALRFKNLGSEVVVFNLYAGDSATNSIVIGSTVNTLDFSGAGADTLTEIAADIAACTNSAGVPVLLVDIACAVGTDSTDDELLDAQTVTVAAASGSKQYWGEIVWDTSVHLAYDVYIPNANMDPNGVRSDINIAKIYGNPLGTGARTSSIYIDGDLAWQSYDGDPAARYTNETALADFTLARDVGIPAGTKSVLLRVECATTATTGMVGLLAVPNE